MKFPSTRLRRNRKSEWSRRLINDTYLDKSDFILPIFVCEGKNKKQEIRSEEHTLNSSHIPLSRMPSSA